jgi:D-glycero-D-manno-heptose 1,7-bisphosphate phosphatase
MGKVAVFVDRDGVVNANRADHVLHWEDFAFLGRARRGLAHLHRAALPVIVVTNQAALARGLLRDETLRDIHGRMIASVRTAGGDIQDVLYCPHDAGHGCNCRKPKPGLFEQAAALHGIDLTRSYYIGDALTDIVAGQAVGCTCILVNTGRGRTQVLRDEARHLRDYQTAADLLSAARWIVNREAPKPRMGVPRALTPGRLRG